MPLLSTKPRSRSVCLPAGYLFSSSTVSFATKSNAPRNVSRAASTALRKSSSSPTALPLTGRSRRPSFLASPRAASLPVSGHATQPALPGGGQVRTFYLYACCGPWRLDVRGGRFHPPSPHVAERRYRAGSPWGALHPGARLLYVTRQGSSPDPERPHRGSERALFQKID